MKKNVATFLTTIELKLRRIIVIEGEKVNFIMICIGFNWIEQG